MNDKVMPPRLNKPGELAGEAVSSKNLETASVHKGSSAPEGTALPIESKEVPSAPVAGAQESRKVGSDQEILRQARLRSRRSFLVAGAAALAGISGWRWLTTRRMDDDIPWPLRSTLQLNEQLARDYFKSSRLAPAFALSRGGEPKVNGTEGMVDDLDLSTWKLRVLGLSEEGGSPADGRVENTETGERGMLLNLEDIKMLPRVEMVTELKCIEGWSQIVRWAGARFSDFAAKFGPSTRSGAAPDVRGAPEDLVRYVSLETPGNGYYVGLDMTSALHPQTLLCYEMNGEPLSMAHGAPLRLAIPVKYGIKNIKRIGTIRFTDQRPADYWAERGYDWYAGH
jgi:hypothetical protein